jgi:hypothetical protein
MPLSDSPPRLALIACSVFDAEIELLAANAPQLVERRRLEIGLHDRPDHLRAALQKEIDALDARDDLTAVVLAYGLCGRGTEGLRAGRHPLVIARAHDCITHFLGDKETYAARQEAYPDTYYYTPGWNQARRVPGPERLEAMKDDLAKRFDPEDVEFLLETEREQWARRGRAMYLHLGTANAASEAAYAQGCANWLGWSFEERCGAPALLRDLLEGRWDDLRFQIVPPGGTLVFTRDTEIFSTKQTT